MSRQLAAAPHAAHVAFASAAQGPAPHHRAEPPRWGAAPPGAALSPRAEGPFHWDPLQATRVALFPILHDDLWEQHKKVQRNHWVVENVDLSHDRFDWERRMKPAERAFIKVFLAWFSRGDAEVLDLVDEIAPHVEHVDEARLYLNEQRAQEGVHIEAYNKQIEALGLPAAEVAAIQRAFLDDPHVRALADWAQQWKAPGVPIGELLVADAFVEGGFFQSAFAVLRWLRERNLLPGITEYNEYIIRDEGDHTESIGRLVARLAPAARPSTARIHEIARSGAAVAAAFATHSLPALDAPGDAGLGLVGMNRALLAQSIEHQFDAVCGVLGEPPLFGAPNPFPFMEKAALIEVHKGNFFEVRTHAYSGLKSGALAFCVRGDPVRR